jgi:hypothetical protein
MWILFLILVVERSLKSGKYYCHNVENQLISFLNLPSTPSTENQGKHLGQYSSTLECSYSHVDKSSLWRTLRSAADVGNCFYRCNVTLYLHDLHANKTKQANNSSHCPSNSYTLTLENPEPPLSSLTPPLLMRSYPSPSFLECPGLAKGKGYSW